MKRIFLVIIGLILIIAGESWSAEWYVRPFKGADGSIYGTGNGSSYANAYNGLYGGSAKVTAVDTGTEVLTTDNTVSWFTANVPVMFTTDGTLPSPLVAGTVYWIRTPVDDTHLKVATELYGGVIDLTTEGSGNIYIHTAYGPCWNTIVGGDTVYFCDDAADTVITGAALSNASSFTSCLFQSSGSAGQPITVTGDPTLASDAAARTHPGSFYSIAARFPLSAGWVVSLPTPVFTGTGLDDMTSQGTPTLTTGAVYLVTLAANGTPDTFDWTKNGSGGATGIAITGNNQTLADGIAIKFNATTGHTIGDAWSITTGTNGTYQIASSGSPNMIAMEDKALMNRTIKYSTDARPSKTVLDGFAAGDAGYWGTGKIYYVKAKSGSTDPNNHVYLAIGGLGIKTNGQSYVNFTNLSTYFSAFQIDTAASNIGISNCTMKYGRYGVSATGNCSNLTINNNTIDYCADGIYTIQASPDLCPTNVTITNNTITNCDYTGTINTNTADAHSIGIQGGSGTVIGNIIDNCSTGPFIYDSYQSNTSWVVSRNYVSNTYTFGGGGGQGIESMMGAAKHDSGSNVEISNNIVVNSGAVGIEGNTPRTSWGDSAPLKVWNNTIYNAAETAIRIVGWQNNEVWASVLNNICHTHGNTYYFGSAIGTGAAVSTWLLTWDYNNYYPDTGTGNQFYFADSSGGGADTYANWKALSFSPDSHSIVTDPLFLNTSGLFNVATDFRLSALSGAINTGIGPVTTVLSSWSSVPGGYTEIWSAATETGHSSWAGDTATNRNNRNKLTSTNISDDATTIRIRFKQNASGVANVTSCYIGPKKAASDVFDFDAAPTQVLVGGSGSFTIAQGTGETTSDDVTFTVDKSKDYLIALHVGTLSYFSYLTGGTEYYNTAADESSTQDVTGYSTEAYFSFINGVDKASTAVNTERCSYSVITPNSVTEDGTPLTLRASVALVDANAGSYYYDGSYIYVRASSGVPSTNGKTYAANGGNTLTTDYSGATRPQ